MDEIFSNLWFERGKVELAVFQLWMRREKKRKIKIGILYQVRCGNLDPVWNNSPESLAAFANNWKIRRKAYILFIRTIIQVRGIFFSPKKLFRFSETSQRPRFFFFFFAKKLPLDNFRRFNFIKNFIGPTLGKPCCFIKMFFV